MGCGQSKAVSAVSPLLATQTGERVAVGAVAVEAEPQLIYDPAPATATLVTVLDGQAVNAAGSAGGDQPALKTAAEAWAMPSAIVEVSEGGQTAVVERVPEEGVTPRDGGDREGALEHLSKEIEVTEELCANDRAQMDRLAGVRGEVAGVHGESEVGAAEAKTAQASDLEAQGEYEKALELVKEALGIYQAELSEEVRGEGCSAGAWVWGVD
ncbi:hypothetical protein T484DRAFT_2787714 [Baffinella frigidus]|nr:hypothetical protein T484DRAFT_2787714 [Cryptophyta sp. CCMP2293]